MQNIQYSIYAIAIYLIILIVIVYFSSRKETPNQFIIGGRKVGIIGTIGTLVSGFRDGAGIAVWVSIAIYYGFGALWLTAGLGTALFLLAYKSRLIRLRSEKEDFITVGDLIKTDIGPLSAQLSSLIIAGTAFLYSAAQLFVSGRIFSEILGVHSLAGIYGIGIVVCLYLIAGGYQTVIRTDIFQWLIIMVIITLPFLLRGPTSWDNNLTSLFSPGWETGIGFFGISFLVVYSGADVWQRIFSARSPDVAKKSFLLTVPVYFFISIGLIFLGLMAKNTLQDIPPGEAFFSLFSSTEIHPIAIAALGVFSGAAVMSTLDTQVFLFASTLARNIFPTHSERNRNSLTKKLKIIIPTLMLILAFIAGSIGNIIEFLFSAVTLGTVLAPILFFCSTGLIKPSNLIDKLIMWCLIFSVLIYSLMFIYGYFANIILTMVPSLISTFLCFLVVSFYKLKPIKKPL